MAELRQSRGLSQTALARAVGVTFQQVQKYEHGTNRISASRLWDICEVLGVDIAVVFRGAGTARPSEDIPGRTASRILQGVSRLSEAQRKLILGVVEAFPIEPSR